MKRITVRELAELRERLEGGAARDAARKATRSDLERLGEIVVELESVSKKQELWPRALELDLQFHERLAEASGNGLTYAVMCSILDCMREAFEAIPNDQGGRVFRDHRRIRAEQALQRHIRYFTGLIQARGKRGGGIRRKR
jgi:DNA-binding FadR family transcriptional regulator